MPRGGSQFTRTLDYFRNADITEAGAALEKAANIIADREKRQMKEKAQIADTPTRKRRSKKNMNASAAAGAQPQSASDNEQVV